LISQKVRLSLLLWRSVRLRLAQLRSLISMLLRGSLKTLRIRHGPFPQFNGDNPIRLLKKIKIEKFLTEVRYVVVEKSSAGADYGILA
jgi:hypothetical protein